MWNGNSRISTMRDKNRGIPGNRKCGVFTSQECPALSAAKGAAQWSAMSKLKNGSMCCAYFSTAIGTGLEKLRKFEQQLYTA